MDIVPDSKGERWAGGGQRGEVWTLYPTVKARGGRVEDRVGRGGHHTRQ